PPAVAARRCRGDRPVRSQRRRLGGREGRRLRAQGAVGLPDQLCAHHAARPRGRRYLGARLMEGVPILSILLLVPFAGAVACLFSNAGTARAIALTATLVTFVLSIVMWLNFDVGGPQWQFTERAPIFAGFSYALGIDGIALLLIVLSTFLMPIC